MNDATRALLFAVGLVSGCQDNEQRARAMGAEARSTVARRCTADAGSPDEEEACVSDGCRAECARGDVPRGFDGACRETCRQTGVCATSEDCGEGSECVAVAPVVRRCVKKAVRP
jgi:hypothetical protein